MTGGPPIAKRFTHVVTNISHHPTARVRAAAPSEAHAHARGRSLPTHLTVVQAPPSRVERQIVLMRYVHVCTRVGTAPVLSYEARQVAELGGRFNPLNAVALQKTCHSISLSLFFVKRTIIW